MSSVDARLDRLMPALSARERGILVLRSLKDRAPEDPKWRSTMPESQFSAFNRYIGLMNALNLNFAAWVCVFERMVDRLKDRVGWLYSMRLWDLHVAEIRCSLLPVLKEPITVSEHSALLAKAKEEWVAVSDLAEVLADNHDWAEADLMTVEGWDQRVVNDAAWDRVVAEEERELRALAGAGKLEGRGKGKSLRLRQGAFYDWLGEPLAVYPDWAPAYEVLPDDAAADVEAARKKLQSLKESLEFTPLDLLGADPSTPGGFRTVYENLKLTLAEMLRERWQELLAIDVVLEEAAEEFGGEDPVRPSTREGIEDCRGQLLGVQADLARLSVDVELPVEADEEALVMVKTLIERARGNY